MGSGIGISGIGINGMGFGVSGQVVGGSSMLMQGQDVGGNGVSSDFSTGGTSFAVNGAGQGSRLDQSDKN